MSRYENIVVSFNGHWKSTKLSREYECSTIVRRADKDLSALIVRGWGHAIEQKEKTDYISTDNW